MATPVPSIISAEENHSAALPSIPKRKGKPTSSFSSANAIQVDPIQHRAVRFVSFMLEDGKYEITPAEFLAEALARHFTFYQSKRGIEFPPKMLAELTAVGVLSGKPASEE